VTDYVPPDRSGAEYVYRKNEVLRVIRNRLGPLSDKELKTIAENRNESTARLVAIGLLLMRVRETADRNRETIKLHVAELLGEFLDEPDPHVATMAIRQCPLIDQQHIEKVRGQLESSDDHVKAAAALALAKINDPSVVPKVLGWFDGDNAGLRNVAIAGFKTLNTEQARNVLVAAFEEGGRGEEDRIVLATALLRMGDTRGLEFLVGIVRRARGALSAMAATCVYAEHEADEGLRLMLHVLDNGDLDAKRLMVWQICYSFMHSPHACTADGIHEARFWIERKLASFRKYGP
jgi:hypothetical protein